MKDSNERKLFLLEGVVMIRKRIDVESDLNIIQVGLKGGILESKV